MTVIIKLLFLWKTDWALGPVSLWFWVFYNIFLIFMDLRKLFVKSQTSRDKWKSGNTSNIWYLFLRNFWRLKQTFLEEKLSTRLFPPNFEILLMFLILLCNNAWNKPKKIKQNWTASGNFHMCFYLTFGCYYKGFFPERRLSTRPCVLPIFRFQLYFLMF